MWVCPVFRHGILSRRIRAGFPPTKLEAGGTVPTGMFAVRRRLPEISLASPPLRFRLGLSWLSYSPPSDLPMVAGMVSSGSVRRQTEAPHASRVERTRLAASPDPTDGILRQSEWGRQAWTRFSPSYATRFHHIKPPALCAGSLRHRTALRKEKPFTDAASCERGMSASPTIR